MRLVTDISFIHLPKAHYHYEDPCRVEQGKLDVPKMQEAMLAVVELPARSPKPDRPQ
jgi:hypothetical protein